MTTISLASRRRAMPAHDLFPLALHALAGMLSRPLMLLEMTHRLSRLRRPETLPDHILKDIGWPVTENDRK